MVALSNFLYVTDLGVDTQGYLFHVILRCVTISSTPYYEPSTLNVYVANPSYTRAAEDQRRRYIRGGADWIHKVTS